MQARARSSGFRDFKQGDKAASPPNLMKSKTILNNLISLIDLLIYSVIFLLLLFRDQSSIYSYWIWNFDLIFKNKPRNSQVKKVSVNASSKNS